MFRYILRILFCLSGFFYSFGWLQVWAGQPFWHGKWHGEAHGYQHSAGDQECCIDVVSPVLNTVTCFPDSPWGPCCSEPALPGGTWSWASCRVRDSLRPSFPSGLCCCPDHALPWPLSIATPKSWPSGAYMCTHSLDTHLSWVTRAGALGIPVPHPLQHHDLATVSISAGTCWVRVACLRIIIFVPHLIFGCLLTAYQTSCGRTVWHYYVHSWPKGIFSSFWSNLVSTGHILENS